MSTTSETVKSALADAPVCRSLRYTEDGGRIEVTVRPFTDPHTAITRYARIVEAETAGYSIYEDEATATQAYTSLVQTSGQIADIEESHAWHVTDLPIPTAPLPAWAPPNPPPVNPVVLRVPEHTAAPSAAATYPVGARVIYHGALALHHGLAKVTLHNADSGTVELITAAGGQLVHVSAQALSPAPPRIDYAPGDRVVYHGHQLESWGPATITDIDQLPSGFQLFEIATDSHGEMGNIGELSISPAEDTAANSATNPGSVPHQPSTSPHATPSTKPAMGKEDPLIRSGAHEHEEGLFLQPLPDCIAPRDEDHVSLYEWDLPLHGQMAVFAAGQVYWLVRTDLDRPAGEDTAQLWTNLALRGRYFCAGATWDENTVTGIELNEMGRDPDDEEILQAAWRLLIDHANSKDGGRPDAT